MNRQSEWTGEQTRAAGALIGTFVGDALGMPVEGWSYGQIQNRHGRLDEMLDARLGRGTFTDDTQMMVATAKSLIDCQGVVARDMADQFLEHYDARRGYGRGTVMVFDKWKRGKDVSNASAEIYEGGSFGNGGSMRIAPVGVFFANVPDQLPDKIEVACGITHAHPLALGSSYVQARTVAKLLNTDRDQSPDAVAWIKTLQEDLPADFDESGTLNETLTQVIELLEQYEEAPFQEVVRRIGCTSKAFESVPAALYSLFSHPDSFEDAVVYAVGIGGDTDTIGAMAGALAGARHGLGAVPDRWWESLEKDTDGRDDIVQLARDLVDVRPTS